MKSADGSLLSMCKQNTSLIQHFSGVALKRWPPRFLCDNLSLISILPALTVIRDRGLVEETISLLSVYFLLSVKALCKR